MKILNRLQLRINRYRLQDAPDTDIQQLVRSLRSELRYSEQLTEQFADLELT
jgi:hypothetical protein